MSKELVTDEMRLEFWKEVVRTNAENVVKPNLVFGDVEQEKREWVKKAEKMIEELSK